MQDPLGAGGPGGAGGGGRGAGGAGPGPGAGGGGGFVLVPMTKQESQVAGQFAFNVAEYPLVHKLP